MNFGMSFEAYVAIGFGLVVSLFLLVLIIWKFPKRIRHDKYLKRWRQLQGRCADREQWGQAIIDADNLLDEALRKKRYKGKSIGERLVEAQKDFSDNDAVWFGHKLRNKIDMNPEFSLRKYDVQKALVGFRQALKDLGVLK